MSALIPEIIPVSRQVAELWCALEPDARPACLQCGQAFPLAGPTGVPSLVCPRCGFVPAENCCRDVLKSLQARQAQSSPTEAAEVSAAPDAARADPPGLDDVIGNSEAVRQIRTAMDAHRARLAAADGRTAAAKALVFPHLICAGPGGTGKTMLAEIIAREVKRPLRLQMGQSLNTPARVADVLLSLKPGDVLFIDEIHGLKSQCQETLYRAMEDGILVPPGKGGCHASKVLLLPVQLPPFTLIGSTTDEWSLLPSLLQRFKYRIRLERMTAAELAQAITQRAGRKGWTLSAEAAGMIADRAHGTPRLALGLLDGCMDVAISSGNGDVDEWVVQATCELWGLDSKGLDRIERRYLSLLSAATEPVRVNVLASQLDNLSRRTLEIKIEPTLLWLNLIEKRPDGRVLTAAGRQHLKGSL